MRCLELYIVREEGGGGLEGMWGWGLGCIDQSPDLICDFMLHKSLDSRGHV